MIVFILWHRSKTGISPQQYESLLRDFHEALSRQDCPGFLASRVQHGTPIPWLAPGDSAYQDLYYLEDSGALDRINHVAVSGDCKSPHDELANWSTHEANGLYRLRSGQPDFNHMQQYWLDKPEGMNHLARLEDLQNRSQGTVCSLWTRQMGLSHGPEFWLQASKELPLQGIHPQLHWIFGPGIES